MERSLLMQKLETVVKYYAKTLADIGEFQTFARIPAKIEIEATLSLPEVQQSPKTQPQPQQISQPMAKKPPQETPIAKIPKKVASTIQNSVPNVNLESFTNLDDLKAELEKSCNCELKTYATKTVFGDGNPNAKILIIGEAPGQEEDIAGVPFIGRSGELLMNAFKSISLEREKNFYITNNIFWRPPGNRKPTDEEMDICRPYLAKIVEIINPTVIICVGSVAAQNVLQTEETISNMRNKVFLESIPLKYAGKIFAIYHPSYLLRNPSKKYDMYKDLLFIKEQIGEIL